MDMVSRFLIILGALLYGRPSLQCQTWCWGNQERLCTNGLTAWMFLFVLCWWFQCGEGYCSRWLTWWYTAHRGGGLWPSLMHGSFFLGLISHLIPHRPWWLRWAPKVMGLGRKVSFLLLGIVQVDFVKWTQEITQGNLLSTFGPSLFIIRNFILKLFIHGKGIFHWVFRYIFFKLLILVMLST